MAEFNPYRDLLNIPPSSSKPDHYALLGLAQFESDASKIDAAADARMEMLQEMSISQHMDAAQMLLNEVSKARRVLLDETKRATYDEELRNPKPAPTATAPTPSVSKQQSTRSSGKGKKTTPQRSSSKSGAKKSGTPMMPIGITSAVVAVLAIVYFAVSGGGSGGSGNVIVEWAMSERGNAEVLLDGKPLPITDTNPLYLDIPTTGRSRLTFKRDGYQDIQKTISSPKGRVRMKLNWVKKR